MSNSPVANSRRYTNEKRIRIVQLFAEGSGCRYVQKKWEKEFQCSPPTVHTITRIYQKFIETGSVANVNKKRTRTIRTEENVTKVFEAFQINPAKSIRKVAQELNIPHSTVARILHDLKGPEGKRIKRVRAFKLGSKEIKIKKKMDNCAAAKKAKNISSDNEGHKGTGSCSQPKSPVTVEIIEAAIIPQSKQTSRSVTAELMFAVNFSAEKHKNQRRKDPEQTPYINHPIGVAYILIEEGGIEDLPILQAAILHDTVEDTETTVEELTSVFGKKVAGIVAELSDNKLLSKEERKEQQIKHAPHKSHEAKLVGMADKIYNLRDLKRCLPRGWDEPRRAEYFVWAKKVCVSYYSENSSLATVLQDIFIEQGLKD